MIHAATGALTIAALRVHATSIAFVLGALRVVVDDSRNGQEATFRVPTVDRTNKQIETVVTFDRPGWKLSAYRFAG